MLAGRMADSAKYLKVPTNRVTVELALHGGERRRVELFLAEHEAHAFRQQSLADLLEEDRMFLPAHAVAEDALVVFNKRSVAWLAIDQDEEHDSEEIELFDEDHLVEIKMRDGTALAGEMQYSPPEGRSRLADHLNDGSQFVCLLGDKRTYFVNKAFVLWVRERQITEPSE